MSAEILRRAAVLMRERAEAATPGPWETGGRGFMARVVYAADESILPEVGCATDAQHIASWHPAVALAVADLIDNEASLIASAATDPDLHMPLNGARVDLLLAVARAYLGDQP